MCSCAALLSRLSACQSGATSACCSAANGLLGFPGSGELAGCECCQMQATSCAVAGCGAAGVLCITLILLNVACMCECATPPAAVHALMLSGLCNADVLEATLSGIEANPLARNAGVTRSQIQTV